MPDQIPQWPFMPAIQGQVPLPKPDPRSVMAKALMSKAPMPLPRPDPRDWATRAIEPRVQDESNSMGPIDPDTLMKLRGYNFKGQTPDSGFEYPGRPGGVSPTQYPLGVPIPQYKMEQDAGNGLFGMPPEHLQQMAMGDVVPLPYPAAPGALTDLVKKQGANEAAARQGGVGFSGKNVDFGLLDKLNK